MIEEAAIHTAFHMSFPSQRFTLEPFYIQVSSQQVLVLLLHIQTRDTKRGH